MATSAVALHSEGRSTTTVLTAGGWSFNTIDRDHGNSRQANNEKVGLNYCAILALKYMGYLGSLRLYGHMIPSPPSLASRKFVKTSRG
jgi:hypothetical protein